MTQLTRTVLILMGSACLAACSTYEPFEAQQPATRPTYPTRLPETPQAPAAPVNPPVPEARPTQPVEARPLPPASPSNQPGYVTPSTPPGSYEPLPPPLRERPAPPAYAPPPAYTPPAPPATRTVTRKTVTGKVVEVEGPPRTYTVAKGDNLDAIGRKMDLSRKELADLNKLKEPYALRPGQTLKGPASKAKAYVVVAGDTMFAVSRRFGVSAKDLAAENDLKTSASLRVGSKLRLPAGYRDKGPIVTTVRVEAPPAAPPLPPPRPTQVIPPAAWTPQPPPTRPPVQTPPPAAAWTPPVTTRPPQPAPGVQPIVPSTGVFSDSQISQLGRGRFIWPLRGELISAFGPKGTGQRNDGLNIRANPSDPVRAAASGDVVYAGDQVPGFGNLVLVKHADGWVTAYGHLARVDVKMQQKVGQGQQIGLAGSSGGVGEPQLHFEVRYAPTPADRARPIDPALVLPK